jgi:hypothetical protein
VRDILCSSNFECGDIEPEQAGGCLNLAHLGCCVGCADIGHDRYSAETGDNLAQEFESLASEIDILDRQAGDVAAGPRQARDQTVANRVPALASVLSARVIPARGGESEYVSTRLAWERLDPVHRARLENSFAWHDYAHSRGKIAPDLASPEERAVLPPQCWRMVWKNPVNGRGALYLASHAYAIEGMEQAAGQKFLAELMDAATAPGLSYVHTWRNGDVVMWDNRATMHRGRPWPAHEARRMVRTTISAREADGLDSVRMPPRQAAE